MRRGMVIGVTLLVIAAGVGLTIGAYHAGVNHGIAEAGDSRVVRVVEPAYGYGFPFGLLLFPLVIFGVFAIAGSFRRRRWAAMGPGGHGGGPGWGRWDEDAPEKVREWHRRLHEQGAGTGAGAGGEPTSTA